VTDHAAVFGILFHERAILRLGYHGAVGGPE
jgi:hypothetical protein